MKEHFEKPFSQVFVYYVYEFYKTKDTFLKVMF